MDKRSVFLAGLVGILAVVGFLVISPFLQYIMGAALLAFILYPVHVRLVEDIRYVGPRVSAGFLTALTIVVAVVPLLIFTLIIFDTVISYLETFQVEDIQAGIDQLRELTVDLIGVEPGVLETIETRVVEELLEVAASIVDRLLDEVYGLLQATIRTSVGLLLLIFLLYYFIVDGKTLLHWLRATAPVEDETIDELYDEVSKVTWAVIGSHLLVAIVEGILGGIGLYIVGFPNATFWAVVMIIVSILPVIGVWLVWGPAVIYLLLVGDIFAGIFLLAYGLAVLSVVDNYLRAIFVDRGSGLHPAIVLTGVLGGIYVIGILGLFLGPVILAVLKATVVVFVRDQDGPQAQSGT